MIVINVDSAKNSILIKMAGAISQEESNKTIVKLFELAPKMKKDFYVINDLSGLESLSKEQSNTLAKVHEKLISTYPVKKIIRVIGRSRTVLLQLSVADKKIGLQKITYVPTMQEAIKQI